MTWEGAVGAPERLDELKTMHEDGHEHRSLQLDRQQHGCSLILMPLTVTACPRARSDLTCLSGSTAALRASCALPCVANASWVAWACWDAREPAAGLWNVPC